MGENKNFLNEGPDPMKKAKPKVEDIIPKYILDGSPDMVIEPKFINPSEFDKKFSVGKESKDIDFLKNTDIILEN